MELLADLMPNPLSQRAPGLGQDLARCYQCGKCTAGCPIARGMDIPPHQVVGLLRLGQVEVLSQAESLWLCVGCGACWVRCPNGIHVGELVDALRQSLQAVSGGGPGQDIAKFHQLFLEHIRRRGRVYELGLLARYKIVTGGLFQDLPLAVRLLRRGKIPFFPPRPPASRRSLRVGRLFRLFTFGKVRRSETRPATEV